MADNIVTFPAKPPPPPPELGATGAELWRSIAHEWRVGGAAAEILLLNACQCADRAESLRLRVQADGEIIRTPHGSKAHPLIILELQARALGVRLLGRLGVFDGEKKRPGRPPNLGW